MGNEHVGFFRGFFLDMLAGMVSDMLSIRSSPATWVKNFQHIRSAIFSSGGVRFVSAKSALFLQEERKSGTAFSFPKRGAKRQI